MTKVKNLVGTVPYNCSCGSWLKHWKKFSGRSTNYCSAARCMQKENLVGAHVQKVNAGEVNWYITPFCKTHNASKKEVEIFNGCALVSANKSKTCK